MNIIIFNKYIYCWLTICFILITFTINAYLIYNCNPKPWTDEVYIAEFGRVQIEKDTNWGALEILGERIRKRGNSVFLGVRPQYWVYSKFGYKIARLYPLALGCLTSFVAFILLRQLNVTNLWSCIISLLLLWDPHYSQSYTSARCDSSAIFLCLVSLILFFKSIIIYHKKKYSSYIYALFAFIVFVLSCYAWTTIRSSALVFLILFIIHVKENKLPWKEAFYEGLILFFIVLLCYYILHYYSVSSNKNIINHVIPQNQNYGLGNKQIIINKIISFISLIIKSPIFYVSGLLLLLSKYKYKYIYIFSFIVLLAVFFCTKMYVFRIIYMIPINIITLGIFTRENNLLNNKYKKVFLYITVISLCFCFGYSLLRRNYLLYKKRDELNPIWVENAFSNTELSNNNNATIMVQPRDLYYIGRNLGWRQFSAVSADIFKTIHYDYLILSKNAQKKFSLELIEEKYELISTISCKDKKSDYGPYEIWRNKHINKQQ